VTTAQALATPGTVTLQGGDSSVVILPTLGGRVLDITTGGRSWLWRNSDVPLAPPAEGASFAASGDAGGLVDCFPTIAPGLLPTWVKGAGSLALGDHGDLWMRAPEFALETGHAGLRARCVWTGEHVPYSFSRTIAVRGDGAIVFSYVVENPGANRMPFLWSPHTLFPLTNATRLFLPDGARTRVGSQLGVDFGGMGAEHHWPRMRHGSAVADVSRPARALKEPYACKVFVDMPRTDCVLAIEEGDARLEMQISGSEIPQVAVSINRGAIGPLTARKSLLPWKKAVPYATVSLEPSLGAPDALADAVGAWDAAQWVEPGGAVRWTMTWRGMRAAEEP
jgi:galactose mutarotase-like enzyme